MITIFEIDIPALGKGTLCFSETWQIGLFDRGSQLENGVRVELLKTLTDILKEFRIKEKQLRLLLEEDADG